jgi:thiol-disulfide isomerase/thioredoxin
MVTEITIDDMQPGVLPLDNDMHVIMFYGAKCGPCKATMPFYEAAAEFYTLKDARINFYKLHVWESDDVRNKCSELWNVGGVPHFKIFAHGECVVDRVGGHSEQATMLKMIQDGIDLTFRKFGERI